MPDNHYVNSRLAALYDLDSGWSADRDFYLSLAASHPSKILDIGCGTGLLCNQYAAIGHDVTGVDPSAAMLDVGRKKNYGNKIEWVQSSAQNFLTHKQFDLIIMTGHAFQVLIEVDDVLATFSTMQKHLKPDGLVVFESRNPAINWGQKWNYDMEISVPDGSIVKESRRFISMRENKMFFELQYQFHDELLKSESLLRFWTQDEIEENAAAAGLCVDKILGDWDEKLFEAKTSEEMIFFLRSKK